MIRLAIVAAILSWAGAAAADLYRWVDPETGSIKFSSYPPPWFGDPARERRAPKVEVIPERSVAPSSAPKPEEEARHERRPAASPLDKTPERTAGRPVDMTPDGPAGKTAAKPPPAATKEEPGDGR